jgi:hypothetical protein
MDIKRDCHESPRRPRLEIQQFRKVGLEDAKTWMERRLARMRSGIPNSVATEMTSTWAQQLNPSLGDLDERIANIEATNLAQNYTQTHMPRLGNMIKMQPEGVFRLLGGQINSALSTNACLRKTGNIVQQCKEFEIQGGSLLEVGVNWSTFPQSADLASWFRDKIPYVRTHLGNNKHEGAAHHQPGGMATFACGELVRYVKQKGGNFRGLGRWCSSLIYAKPKHCTQIVLTYNVGHQTPKGESTIYQQRLRYIQDHGLLITPTRLFTADFVAQLQVWQRQGDRLLIFMDINKHALCGPVACHLIAMGLTEATHHHWGDKEPHTYISGVEPINGVWHTPDLKVLAVLQLSFHKGVSNHHTVLVNITTYSTIGRQEFKVVHPHAWRLNSPNH